MSASARLWCHRCEVSANGGVCWACGHAGHRGRPPWAIGRQPEPDAEAAQGPRAALLHELLGLRSAA